MNIPRSAIVWMENPSAVHEFRVSAEAVQSMFQQAITCYTQTSSVSSAWKALGLRPDDRVGIKITTAGGQLRCTHQALVNAVVQSLASFGIPPGHVIIWDKFESEMINAGYTPSPARGSFPAIKAVIPNGGFDSSAFYVNEMLGKLIWGDHQFHGNKPSREELLKQVAPSLDENNKETPAIVPAKGEDQTSNKSFFAKVLTQECTKIINIPALSDHQTVGLFGCLSSLALGSLDNTRRFSGEETNGDPAIPEILDRDLFKKKVILHIMDALIAQYAGGPEFSPQFTNSIGAIGLSRDPVALDAHALQLIKKWRVAAKIDPLGSRDKHIATAAQMGLGIDNPKQIDILKHKPD